MDYVLIHNKNIIFKAINYSIKSATRQKHTEWIKNRYMCDVPITHTKLKSNIYKT